MLLSISSCCHTVLPKNLKGKTGSSQRDIELANMLDKKRSGALALTSVNHISLLCSSLEKSLDFYQNILGFFPVKRPASFGFDGAWLLNHGIGIHLLQAEDPGSLPKKTEINPKDNHISFQCDDVDKVGRRLKEMGISYVERQIEEDGIYVDQLFFHDPDGFMIEICNCHNLPVILLATQVTTPDTVCIQDKHEHGRVTEANGRKPCVSCRPTR